MTSGVIGWVFSLIALVIIILVSDYIFDEALKWIALKYPKLDLEKWFYSKARLIMLEDENNLYQDTDFSSIGNIFEKKLRAHKKIFWVVLFLYSIMFVFFISSAWYDIDYMHSIYINENVNSILKSKYVIIVEKIVLIYFLFIWFLPILGSLFFYILSIRRFKNTYDELDVSIFPNLEKAITEAQKVTGVNKKTTFLKDKSFNVSPSMIYLSENRTYLLIPYKFLAISQSKYEQALSIIIHEFAHCKHKDSGIYSFIDRFFYLFRSKKYKLTLFLSVVSVIISIKYLLAAIFILPYLNTGGYSFSFIFFLGTILFYGFGANSIAMACGLVRKNIEDLADFLVIKSGYGVPITQFYQSYLDTDYYEDVIVINSSLNRVLLKYLEKDTFSYDFLRMLFGLIVPGDEHRQVKERIQNIKIIRGLLGNSHSQDEEILLKD